MTSLVVTGDLRGLAYIKKSVKELPGNTFGFCCTMDNSSWKEVDLSSGVMSPLKN